MKKFFLFINGNNDLFYPLNKNLCMLLWNVFTINNINLDIVYLLKNIEYKELWKNINDNYSINKDCGIIHVKNNEIYFDSINRYIDIKEINDMKIKILDINKYLNENLNNNNENIVIISGHGGPFQALLDMEEEYPASINTRMLCKEFNDHKIDLLYLDMCAMNYIDTIYEIFYKKNIKNIITYKGLAPYDCEDYLRFINIINSNISLDVGIEKYFYSSMLPLIYLNEKSQASLNECKSIFNNLAKICITEENANFDNEIEKLKLLIKDSIYENEKASKIKGLPLNFIKYPLKSEIDRAIFNNYKFEEDNFYRYLVSKKENKEEPTIIFLEEDSLEHIIGLHNPSFNKRKLEDEKKEFLLRYINK